MLVWNENFSDLPQPSARRDRFGIATRHENAEQDACDVGVENGGPLAKSKAANGAGGVGADSLEGKQRFLIRGQSTSVPRD